MNIDDFENRLEDSDNETSSEVETFNIDEDHHLRPMDNLSNKIPDGMNEKEAVNNNEEKNANKNTIKKVKQKISDRRYCNFKSLWLEKYDFVRQGKNKHFVFCKVCNSEFSIAYGGECVILKHIARAKHYRNSNKNAKGEQLTVGRKAKCPQTMAELNNLICEICGNKFRTRNYMQKHMRYHLDIKNHECEICKKRFRELMHLKRHMRSHTGEKPYACRFCDKKYADYSSKTKHERVHTNERPFVCKMCGKAFMIGDTLKKHIMTHTGERPFHCYICDRKFSRKTHLQIHFKSMVHKKRQYVTE